MIYVFSLSGGGGEQYKSNRYLWHVTGDLGRSASGDEISSRPHRLYLPGTVINWAAGPVWKSFQYL